MTEVDPVHIIKVGDHDAPFRPSQFWARVLRTEDGCWFWTGSYNSSAYGQLTVACLDGARRPIQAHRMAYELLVGPIPEDHEIDHLCRNRICVRPSHIEAVTKDENLRRGCQHRLSVAEPVDTEWAHRVKALTDRHDITVPELADLVGATQRTVGGWLNDGRSPYARLLAEFEALEARLAAADESEVAA